MAFRSASFALVAMFALIGFVCADSFNIPTNSVITMDGPNWSISGGLVASGTSFSGSVDFIIASGATLTFTGPQCFYNNLPLSITGAGNVIYACTSHLAVSTFAASNSGSFTVFNSMLQGSGITISTGTLNITSSTVLVPSGSGSLSATSAVTIVNSVINCLSFGTSIGSSTATLTIDTLTINAAVSGANSFAWSTANVNRLDTNQNAVTIGAGSPGAATFTDSNILANAVTLTNSGAAAAITTFVRCSITARTSVSFAATSKTQFVESFTYAYSSGAPWTAKLVIATPFTRTGASGVVSFNTNTINSNLFPAGIDGGSGNYFEVTTTGTIPFTISVPGVILFGGSVGGTYTVTSTDGNAVYPWGSLTAGTLVAAVPATIPSLKVFASKTVNLYGSNPYTITLLTLDGPSSVLDVSRQSTVTFDTITGDGTVNGVAEAVILTRVSPRPRITFNVRKVTLDSAIIDVRLNSGTADQVVLQSGAELSVVAPSSFSISGAGTNAVGSGSKVLIADRITGASLGGVPQSQTGLYLGLYGTSYYLINPIPATIASSLFQRQGQVFSLDENIDFLLNVQPPGTPGVPTASDFVIVNAKLKSIRQVADYTTSKRSIEAGAPSDQFIITVAAVCDGLVSVTWSGTVGGTPISAPATFTASYAGCLARQFCL